MEQTQGAVTPDVSMGWTVGQIQAMAAPSGRVTKEQAMEIINRKRAAAGLDPLDHLP